MFYFPDFPKEQRWRSWNEEDKAAVDTAFVLIPLLNIDSQPSRQIRQKGNAYILSKSFHNRLWKFTPSAVLKQKLPFDADSTSLCSYVLSKEGMVLKNKRFLDRFINDEYNYTIYLVPKKFYSSLPIHVQLKLRRITRAATIFELEATPEDWETGITCNTLLYLGKSKKNAMVWDKLKKDFAAMNITTLYYGNMYAYYAYARLYHYGQHADMRPAPAVLDKIIARLYEKMTNDEDSLDFLFLANLLLFFDADPKAHAPLMDQCFAFIADRKYDEIRIYYSGNSKISEAHQNAYFGSPGITCSLCVEFLNLYRKRVYGNYYRNQDTVE